MGNARINCHLNGPQWAISDNEPLEHPNQTIRYQGCGLDNVYLVNGYRYGTLTSGEEVLYIEDVPSLQRAIVSRIMSSAVDLDAKTFKFLRKEQDMSQRKLAETLGVGEQTVTNWESAKTRIPCYAASLLRQLTRKHCSEKTP